MGISLLKPLFHVKLKLNVTNFQNVAQCTQTGYRT
jgi:hypothetical protein